MSSTKWRSTRFDGQKQKQNTSSSSTELFEIENIIISTDNESVDSVNDSGEEYVPFDSERTTDLERKPTKKVQRKKDNCPFCDTVVLNFARHVLRHHNPEAEVQEILSYEIGEKKRKTLFNKLRKRGNFLRSLHDGSVIPVRKSQFSDLEPPTVSDYLPCKYCKGFYLRRFLFRHIKACPHNNGDKTKGIKAQAASQSFFRECKNDVILRNDVFPQMKDDIITFTAKNDTLICAVAKKYLEDYYHSRLNVSLKMRQLATLLIEIKKKKTQVASMLDALDPLNFQDIIECSKLIAATNMDIQLKYCIDVAYNMLFEECRMENEVTSKLKILKDLISTEWPNEFPSEPIKRTPKIVGKNKKKRILEPWTDIQKEVILSYFKDNLKTRIPPKRTDCLQLKEEKPDVFVNKSWEKMRIFIVNTYNKDKNNY